MIGFSRLYVAGVLIAAGAALTGALWGLIAWRESVAEKRGAAMVRMEWEQERASTTRAALEHAQEQARESARVAQKQKEAQDAYLAEIARQRAAMAAADRVADSLRSAAVQAARRAAGCTGSPDSTAADHGATAAEAGRVLADVLAELDLRAGALAIYADASRTAGEQCQRSYDALGR